MFAPVP